MKYITVKQARELDLKVTDKYFIPSILLMENAGREVALNVLKYSPRTVYVICGAGNNAGDGFVCARYLHNRDKNVEVYILKKPKLYEGDTLINYRIIKKLKVKITYINKIDKLIFNRNRKNIIVDAIFGTGLNRSPEGIYSDVIESINSSGLKVISIDVPSGMDADKGLPVNICVRADLTVTMGFMKKGYSYRHSKKWTGKIIVADIGYPKNIFI